MLNGQDILNWWTAIGALGGIVAAVFSILAYRSRHGVPHFLPELDDQPTKGRFIVIRQSDDKDWWHICSVRLARTRREWLAETGPLYKEAKWRNRIEFSRPSGRQQTLFLHPAASSKQVLCLTVRLQADSSVKRRIKRPLYSPDP